jgi:hypothetical protein
MDVRSDGCYGCVLMIGEHKATLLQRSNDESAMMPLEHTILGIYSLIMVEEMECSRGTTETAVGGATTINRE